MNEQLPSDSLSIEHERGCAKCGSSTNDAAKYRWALNNSCWIRGEHAAYVAIPVAREADLSCVAMRDAAIDEAMEKEVSNGHSLTNRQLPTASECIANARLIAAAPDLLALAKRMLAAWEGSGPGIVLDDIRALIAKAEGRNDE